MEKSAKRLRGNHKGAIVLGSFLEHLGVRFLIEFAPSGEGALSLGADGVWQIIVYRKANQDSTGSTQDLTPRERYTIAHEIGHILLIKKFGFNPKNNAGPLYHKCKLLCQYFASQLLIDYAELTSDVVLNATQGMDLILTTRKRFLVSAQAAARAVVYTHPGTSVIHISSNGSRSPYKLDWGFLNMDSFQLTARKFSRAVEPKAVLADWISEVDPSCQACDFCCRSSYGDSGYVFSTLKKTS